MINAYFDLETTDFPEKIQGDGIIQIGVAVDGLSKTGETITSSELCNPGDGVRFSPNAMSVHHITPDMVAGLPNVRQTTGFKTLAWLKQNLGNHPQTNFFVYNMSCDIVMLQRVGLDLSKDRVIDVFRLARFINDKLNLPWESNGLQYMMYATGAYKRRHKGQAKAHDALADTLDLKYLWEFLSSTYNITTDMALQVTNNPIFYSYVPYGANRGKRFSELSNNQLRWMYDNNNDADIKFTLEKMGLI